MPDSPTPTHPSPNGSDPWVRRSRRLLPLDFLRGFLIGLAELVPGVSGGTVALVTGLYDRLIDSAAHLVAGVRRLATGPDRVRGFRTEIARTDWWLVLPVLAAMAAAVLTLAGTMETFVSDHAELSRGLFFGLVAASVAVPLLMLDRPVRRASLRDVAIVLAGAVVAWVLIGFAGDEVIADPPLYVVFLAAALAVCALVVPGISGSFFLLAVGLYAPTLQAVDDRNLTYIAVFMAGAVVGLASFVQLLRWLLHSRRHVTLLVMAGLMIGSLRALWPWRTEPGEDSEGPGTMIAPYAPVSGPILLALLGAVVVIVLIVVERRLLRRAADPDGSVSRAA